ncbi:hypothetical protein WM40_06140 [Robbsia andropogonis]|uniref:Uncharacterized protein n=1 Tax=Robbsia andropogonis TaxID=28092 RepID=A0A0F5K3J6_9BURK|nr:hypothetical protein WM40_06140 [Robbsia andropogonis]
MNIRIHADSLTVYPHHQTDLAKLILKRTKKYYAISRFYLMTFMQAQHATSSVRHFITQEENNNRPHD